MIKDDLSKYLRVLGFHHNERPTLPQIKKRWKDLCRKCHPDTGGNVDEFRRVTHAFKMLTDPDFRQKEIINEIKKGNANKLGDLNIRIQIPITFEDGFFGRQIVVSFNRLEMDEDLNAIIKEEMDVVTRKVRVPEGSLQGYEYLGNGLGHKSRDCVGDALMVFTPLPHPKFRAQGSDILSQELIPLETMLKGGTLEILTMYGMKTLKVPPGTQPSQTLRIKRCGVGKVADHLVQVEPRFPTKDELKGDVWEKLGINWDENFDEDEEARELIIRFKSIMGEGGTFGTTSTRR